MDKNLGIEITSVSNGYIVRPNSSWFQQDDPRRWPMASADYLVFRSMAELTRFLVDHFEHRAELIFSDPDSVTT